MKFSETILKFAMIAFIGISLVFLIVSIIDFVILTSSHSFEDLYSSVAKFGGIHSFTIAISATYLGINRLRLSHENHLKTMRQLQLSEEEIQRRRQVEMNDQTLKQCETYLTEIQKVFKDLIQHESYNGIPVVWSRLDAINRHSLEKHYPKEFEKFRKSEKKLKNQSLLTLYKLESLSASFLHGNTDLELGKKMIGDIFCGQVGYLEGILAYYRFERNEKLFQNTLDLHDRWE